MSSSCFVSQIDPQLVDKLKADLIEQGFELSQPNYTLFQAKKKNLSCTLYSSYKLTVQGKGMEEFIKFYLEPEILKSFSYGYENLDLDLSGRMGVDESGKGDFFGPLCIAGVFAEGDDVKKLAEIGAKDSKKLSDAQCIKIAEKIKKSFAHHIVRISPLKYNELYIKFANLNTLLAWGHATVIENLLDKTDCSKVVIDRFASEHVVENALKRKKSDKKIELVQKVRAEEDLVVAAASILARAAFLEGLEKLEKEYSQSFPKGASTQTIKAGKEFIEKNGIELLKNVCKIHFKTYQQILE